MDDRFTNQTNHQRAGFAYGTGSLVFFCLALLLFLLSSTVFDSLLGSIAMNVQRWIAFTTLIVPALVGSAMAVLGLGRGTQPKRWSIIGLLLNTCFALFIGAVLAMAG